MPRKEDYTVHSDGDDNAEVFFSADNPNTSRFKLAVPGVKDQRDQLTGEHRRIAIQRAREVAKKFLDFSNGH